MSEMKRLFKETAIYGVSSILGRFLNWCLVPFYTYVLTSSADYGIITNLYAWISVVLVILTYGMETGFFRFINKENENPEKVYSTSLFSLASTSGIFILLLLFLLSPVSKIMGFSSHPDYVFIMGLIVAMDAFTSLPFAYLRYKNKAVKFAVIKLLMIGINIFFNIFFLVLCPEIYKSNPGLINWFYSSSYGVGYVFVSNFISSLFVLIVLIPDYTGFKWIPDFSLLKLMLKYSLPLLLLGVAGIMNQSLDKIMFPFLFSDKDTADAQLGIYGACFKIGLVMMMFTQAFRYAYEPFVFSKQRNKDNKESYSQAMSYYFIVSVFAFLSIMFFLDLLQYIISAEYREGLVVVPIVLLCYIFQGIYFNLSFWYKLSDKTIWGTYISFMGLAVTVLGNIIFVPRYGYIAAAWVSCTCFFFMMMISWLLGRKYYPISYDLKLIFRYVVIGLLFYIAGMNLPFSNLIVLLSFRFVLLCIFLLYVIKKDVDIKVLFRKR